ncbi:hypothetical protein HY251_18630 [bacterium]|nr:hypothetical protein [bacterium]
MLDARTRDRIGAAALTLVGATILILLIVQTSRSLPSWDGEAVTILERRLAPLRADLAARGLSETGKVGYVSRVSQGENLPGDSSSGGRDFLAAQYALAPILLVNSPDLPLVIGDLPGPESVAPILSANRLAIETDHGSGAYLLRRAE